MRNLAAGITGGRICQMSRYRHFIARFKVEAHHSILCTECPASYDDLNGVPIALFSLLCQTDLSHPQLSRYPDIHQRDHSLTQYTHYLEKLRL